MLKRLKTTHLIHAPFPGPPKTRWVGTLPDDGLDFALRAAIANKEKDGNSWESIFIGDFHG